MPVRRITWVLDNLRSVANHDIAVVGAPHVIESDHGPAVVFDGAGDALLIDCNPLEGAAAFTVEALFRPDAGGPAEQRFLHLQDNDTENRAMLETRLPTPAGPWYADTYIRCGTTDMPLNDPALTHPTCQWHTLALTLDGRQMVQYVNGAHELSANISDFHPYGPGRASIGARMNRVYWFKGAIRLIRFTLGAALGPGELLVP